MCVFNLTFVLKSSCHFNGKLQLFLQVRTKHLKGNVNCHKRPVVSHSSEFINQNQTCIFMHYHVKQICFIYFKLRQAIDTILNLNNV